MYALISENNIVCGLESASFDVAPPLSFVEIPSGAVVEYGYVYANDAFTNPNAPDLPTAQRQQMQILSSACAGQIIDGFASSALGVVHTYASGDIDQQNIVQSAQSSKGGLLSCADANGAWSRQPHTQAQAQQALEDFVVARDAERTKLGTLQAQVGAATTIEAVQEIVWQEVAGG